MNIKQYIHRAFLLFCYTLIVSCGNNTKINYAQELAEKITVSDDHLIRSVDLGMPFAQVKNTEKLKPANEEANYLLYEATTDSSDSYTIAYTFDSDSLIEIRIDIYMIQDKLAAEVVTEIKQYFTDKYEEPITNNNLLFIWGVKINGKAMRIELEDESEEYKQGKIGITIYRNWDADA